MMAAHFKSPHILLSCALALCAAPLAAAQDDDSAGGPSGEFPNTTLAGIYELALKDDFTIAQARAQFRVDREARKLALSGLLPRVNAGYTKSDNDTESEGSFSLGGFTVPSLNRETETDVWNVSLSQSLFDLPAWFEFKRGVEQSKQAEAVFSLAQQTLVARAIGAYVAVLRASANLRALRSQEEALKAQLDQVRQRFDVGLVAITDVLEAEAGYDLAVARRIEAEGNLDTSREQLSLLTGRPHGELWPLKADFPVNNPDPESREEWVKFALTNNLEIKVAHFGREATRRAMMIAKTQYYPRISLSVRHSDTSQETTQPDFDPVTQQIVGETTIPLDQLSDVISIDLTMPIYSGGGLNAGRRQAVARYDTQSATYDGTVRRVTQETRALFSQVVSDVSTTRARARAVASSESALEAAEIGYEVGTRNVVDVLNAQQSFFSATRDYDNSILDYVGNLVQLKQRAGILSPQDIYELNAWLTPPKARQAEAGSTE